MLFTGLVFLSTQTSITLLSCILMNNEECKVRPQIVDIDGDDSAFFSFSIKTGKCRGSCDNINNPCAKLCVPDVVNNLNLKVSNLVTGTNEIRRIEWHEKCKCKCRFNSNFCNNKQRWNIIAGINAKNWLIKSNVIRNLFGILVIVSVNVINPVILVSI